MARIVRTLTIKYEYILQAHEATTSIVPACVELGRYSISLSLPRKGQEWHNEITSLDQYDFDDFSEGSWAPFMTYRSSEGTYHELD